MDHFPVFTKLTLRKCFHFWTQKKESESFSDLRKSSFKEAWQTFAMGFFVPVIAHTGQDEVKKKTFLLGHANFATFLSHSSFTFCVFFWFFLGLFPLVHRFLLFQNFFYYDEFILKDYLASFELILDLFQALFYAQFSQFMQINSLLLAYFWMWAYKQKSQKSICTSNFSSKCGNYFAIKQKSHLSPPCFCGSFKDAISLSWGMQRMNAKLLWQIGIFLNFVRKGPDVLYLHAISYFSKMLYVVFEFSRAFF